MKTCLKGLSLDWLSGRFISSSDFFFFGNVKKKMINKMLFVAVCGVLQRPYEQKPRCGLRESTFNEKSA